MRIRVDHRTTYRYDAPASGLVQLLRLRPCDHDGQHVGDWRIDIDVDGTLRESRDAFGNRVAAFYADGPLSTLTIGVAGEAEIQDTAGLIRAPEPLPAPVYLRATTLTAATPELVAWARRFAAEPPLAALHALNAAIHDELRFEVGATDSATTAAAALVAGHGVCQDFAHIFVTAARAMGHPARYVSGHLARDDTQDAAHAWAEALVPDLGWVAFDPANGISATDRHLRIAVGLDYLDAAPIRGARRGGGTEHMHVTVNAGPSPRQWQGQDAGTFQSQSQG
ncbi:transglutaminase domain-containing protein [uncultured Sphingomonas sp.]|uniref:transglutaminase family protein n=1 Tax=uncultured Sphingomonas sp. TaxID=158754 RepID=UPI0035CBA89C